MLHALLRPGLFAVLYCLLLSSARGQVIQVIPADLPPYTPENLISNIFLGGGIEVINIKYKGVASAVGYFSDGMQDVGIERGIIMTSGLASGIIGPNNTENFTSINNSTAHDKDIEAILGDMIPQKDVAIYEIEFIPFSDTVQFKYTFASEEYPEYSCSPFNDIFGFFISGPGINGPYENNAENIALIPNTSTPVSINNIHPDFNPPGCIAVNGQYYNNNQGSSTLQYDGVLDVFTAQSKVIPCQVYKIKLVIADASDQSWDSGVFLEAKSFGAGSLSVEATTVSLDGAVAEGCSDAILTFRTQNPVTQDYPIDFKLLGSATNGVDYDAIDPATVIIPKDSTWVSVIIHPIEDGLVEGNESIDIDIRRNVCFRDTFAIYIKDKRIVAPVLPDSVVICKDARIDLDATIPIDLPQPDTFRNTTQYPVVTISDQAPPPPGATPTISEIDVFGVQPIHLTAGMINSVCLNITHPWDDDIDIFLVSPGGQAVELSTDNGADGNNYVNTCFTESAPTKINAPGPFAPASAAPFNGQFLPEGVWSDLYDGQNPSNGKWGIYIKDDQNGIDGTLDNWSIIFNPVYKIKYEWSPQQDLDCYDCPLVLASPDTGVTYIVKAVDTYGCEVFDTVAVQIIGSIVPPVVQCVEASQTSITFGWNPVAGATGYEVNVNGQGWISPNPGPLTHIVTGLDLNESVTIQVRATGECTTSPTVATCSTDDCDNPTAQVLTLQNLACGDVLTGEVTLGGTGGNLPYTFKLGEDSNQTGIFTGLDGGDYTGEVFDATGCVGLINFTIQEPDVLLTTPVVSTPLDCSPNPLGAVTLAVEGGVGPYSFQWSNLSTDSLISGLNAGTYYVTITDFNLCQRTDSVKLSQNLPSLLINVNPVKCFGDSSGTIFLNVEGGTHPLSFAWNGPNVNPGEQSQINLPAGLYQVTVTDAIGCTKSATVPISQPSSPVTGSFSPLDTICFGAHNGEVTVTPSGGSFPYAVAWSNGTFNPALKGVGGGVYTVTITDGKGCQWVDSAEVRQFPAMGIDLDMQDPLCAGQNSGEAQVVLVEYDGDQLDLNSLQYAWNTVPPQFGPAATGLHASSTYIVTVTDLIGCTGTATVSLQDPDPVQINTLNLTQLSCPDDGEGAILIAVSGGKAPYSYDWDGIASGDDQPMVGGLNAGTYRVTVTDGNGCTSTHEVVLEQPEALVNTLQEQNVLCDDQAIGLAAASIEGGTGPYTYLWSNGSQGAQISGLMPGRYGLTVTDSKGCVLIDTADILYLGQAMDFEVSANDIRCFGELSGELVVETLSGAQPFTYSSNGQLFQQSPVLGGLAGGDYKVYVKDANGCVDTSELFSIQQPPPLSVEIGPGFVITIGGDTVLVSQVSGGSPAYTYAWSSSDTSAFSCLDCPNPRITPLEQTGVELTITDEHGCIASDALTIGVKLLRDIFVPGGFSPNGDGNNDLLSVFAAPGITVSNFRVLDRWGEILFFAEAVPVNDPNFGWDGKLAGKAMNPGVFIWICETEHLDGRKEVLTGTATLIR